MQASDLDLVREFAASKSDAAFATLVGRHINLVYSAALRVLGNRHEAEEVAQVVFIILARKAGSMGQGTILSGWLYQTAQLTAANFLRTKLRRERREQEAFMEFDKQSQPNEWPQLSAFLEDAMSRLRQKERDAIVLRFFENRTIAEVAAALGLGEAAAQKRVNRATDKLRHFFASRGLQVSTNGMLTAIGAQAIQSAPAGLASFVATAAISKGTAASSSTLALLKGALKIMAWAKAKKAVATAGLMLVIAGMGIAAFSLFGFWHMTASPDIQGAWEGDMFLPDDGIGVGQMARTHVVLYLVKTNGNYIATTDWIEVGRKGFVMGKVAYDYPYLSIERTRTLYERILSGTWKFRINENATQMILDRTVRDQSSPILFLRTSSPDTVRAPLTEEQFAPGGASRLQGYWEGELDIDLQKCFQTGRIQPGGDAAPENLKISDQGNGNFRAELGAPPAGFARLPATGHYEGTLVKFTDDIHDGIFQGALNEDGTALIGSWTTAGVTVPAKFKRAVYRAEHASDDKKDYSFTSPADLQGHWKGAWLPTIAKIKWTVPLALDIAKMPDGSYSSTLARPDLVEYPEPMPPSDAQYDPPNICLKWKWLGMAWVGTLKDDKLVGVWSNCINDHTFPVTFERTGPQ